MAFRSSNRRSVSPGLRTSNRDAHFQIAKESCLTCAESLTVTPGKLERPKGQFLARVGNLFRNRAGLRPEASVSLLSVSGYSERATRGFQTTIAERIARINPAAR